MNYPILYVVIPCYNEETVLPITCTMFCEKLLQLMKLNKISSESKILFVNDGSKDNTWAVIQQLHSSNPIYTGISLSRNRGHQNALLAGLTEAANYCDISISIDCDGQDDLNAMDKMVDAYLEGCEVVYGVRSSRNTDTFFKRFSAEGYYRILNLLGAEVVFNHADYRLLSKRVLQELMQYKEVNLYLRGMIPLVGFKSTSVFYERHERIAGESHYPLKKMLTLAFDGITSLSVKPLRIIAGLGFTVSLLSFIGIIWAILRNLAGYTITGWSSTICIVCLMGGIQLLSLGIIGEYIGKIYMETKKRPRFIVADRTSQEEQ